MNLYERFGKRVLDVTVASAALVLTAPVLGVAAAAIKLDSSGPVLFVQDRLGRDGRTFRVFKLRTMTHVPRAVREVPLDDPEVTRVGRFLRRTKIDELPQLLNVLRGEMSVVGPRPGMPRMLDELDEVGQKRLHAKPGLTGLAQIHGGIHLSWPERWRYDAAYVEASSLATDLGILIRTVPVLVLGEARCLRRPTAKRPQPTSHHPVDTGTVEQAVRS